jgi:16S rRNA U516 pseudouridylate synthase RsuA-like enzyme
MEEKIKFNFIKLIQSVFGLLSKREAKRLIKAGAVDLDGVTITDTIVTLPTHSEHIFRLRLGKHSFEDIRFYNGKIEVLE